MNVSPYQKVNKWQLLGWTLDNDTIFDEQLMHALCTLNNNETIFTFYLKLSKRNLGSVITLNIQLTL